MFANQFHRRDFADTRISIPDSALTLTPFIAQFDTLDSLEQMAQADAADRTLLRLVACAAGATLLLALAGSLV